MYCLVNMDSRVIDIREAEVQDAVAYGVDNAERLPHEQDQGAQAEIYQDPGFVEMFPLSIEPSPQASFSADFRRRILGRWK
jgi:hypothetical protein